jgi:hypothetical protein
MGRMHNNGKGISRRSLPYSRAAPAWTKTDAKTLKGMFPNSYFGCLDFVVFWIKI